MKPESKCSDGPTVRAVEAQAMAIRRQALLMTSRSASSHIGGCLSVADILAALYWGTLRYDSGNPEWPDRDRVVVSKGHVAAAYYAALALRGVFDTAELESYCENGALLGGHVTRGVPGVEASTGSLGHGLPIACGMAIGMRMDGCRGRVFTVLSDGECDEGSTWEAVLFAAHHRLDNLVAVVDYNGIQSYGSVEEVMNLDPLCGKWHSFGWAVVGVDGHDVRQLLSALEHVPMVVGKPTCVVARTVKGKGVSFMEGRLEWHYRHASAAELRTALAEVGGVE